MSGRREAKRWFLTYPQSGDLTKEEVAEELKKIGKVEEIVVGKENHKDEEGKHIHVYVEFAEKIRWRATAEPKKWDVKGKHPNVQTVRNRSKTIQYCMKEDREPYIEGVDVEAVVGKKKSYARMYEMGLEELKEEVHPMNLGRTISGIHLYKLMKQSATETKGCRGVWIRGSPGAGKSHLVETKYPDAYRKPQNKWWDGYQGEEVVILEDLDGPYLNHYLKVWADKWRASGEVKGATVPLMHKMLVVTSNYSIREIVEMGSKSDHSVDPVLVEALERRFKVIEMWGEEDRETAAEEMELVAKEMGIDNKRSP